LSGKFKYPVILKIGFSTTTQVWCVSMERRSQYWDVRGCRRDVVPEGSSRYESHCPGKRVCHFVEINHCVCAREDMTREKQLGTGFLPRQLKGNEALYRELGFVEGEQRLLNTMGEVEYFSRLRKFVKTQP